ncbi:secreted protein C-like [Bactrocera oleae]|uniref:secreted protein C-like n=1 Tax=Bactrocera oleae TaxID=104688 RepID=UPI00387EA804
MPPPRRRRVKSLAGSEESGPSVVTVDTSGDEAVRPSVRSPPRRKARLGSPAETGGDEGGSGSGSGCDNGDTAEKAAVHPAKSGEGEVGVASVDTCAKKTGASKTSASKGGASNRGGLKGGVVVGGGALHVLGERLFSASVELVPSASVVSSADQPTKGRPKARMPPPRRRRVKSLAGSEESGPSVVTVDTSGDEAVRPSVRSPPRRKARLGSPAETGGDEGGSGSGSGCDNGDTAEKAAVHPAKSGEGEVGVARVDTGAKKTGASKTSASNTSASKGGASNRGALKGVVVVGGGAFQFSAVLLALFAGWTACLECCVGHLAFSWSVSASPEQDCSIGTGGCPSVGDSESCADKRS